MVRVHDCIVCQHELRLVVVAALIALFGSDATIRLLRHVATLAGGQRRIWLAASALAIASAIWSTHFVALLAFQPGIDVGYDLVLTASSFAVAVGMTCAGLAIALSRSDAASQVGGGCVIGLGASVMHYLGMEAMQFPGFLTWDFELVAGSVLVACALAGAAMLVARKAAARWARPIAGVLLALAMCVMHFMGMAASTLHLAAAIHPAGPVLAVEHLAALIAAACLIILSLGIAGVVYDQRRSRKLAAETANLHNLADIAVEGLVVCDGDTVVAANRSFAEMTGRREGDLVGATVDVLFAPAALSHAAFPPGEAPSDECHECVLAAADGRPIPVEIWRKPILYAGRPHQVMAFRDLRERRRAEEEIRFLAHHDTLTGLNNRAAFAARLERQLAAQAIDQQPFALLALDLDRFKQVNDTLGHPAGDQLLKDVAERLRAATRADDFCARLGGDEFMVLVSGHATPAIADKLARRLVDILRAPYEINGSVAHISASVGIVVAPKDGDGAEELMKNVDFALYRAKAEGRSMACFFEPSVATLMRSRRTLEAELRHAIANDELDVFYQPIFDVRDQRTRGFEALVRWYHPQRGLIAPDEFISLAEDTELILPIGTRVLNRAAAQAASWGNVITVTVNMSTRQLADAAMVETVRTALDRSGLSPHRLELEIPESALRNDRTSKLEKLRALREMGVHIAAEDFGTGYCAFGDDGSFPFDRIKIDRSFVRDMIGNRDCAAVVDSVIGFGRRLGVPVTATGVETAEQMSRLAREGCDMVQGYFIGRPEAAPDAARHLPRAARTGLAVPEPASISDDG